VTERKDLIQSIESATAENLLSIVQDACAAGYRLCQICATAIGDSIEVLYTFELDNVLENYKLEIDAKAPELQSITAIYPYAFIYENEMNDLFGVKFKNLGLDYGGKFFKTAEKTPWNPALRKGGEN
jgi:ech hydrogenase subunit D